MLNKNKITGVLEKTRANSLFFKTPMKAEGDTDKPEADELEQAPIQPMTFEPTHDAETGSGTEDTTPDSKTPQADTIEHTVQADTASDTAESAIPPDSSGSDNTSSPAGNTHSAASSIPMRASTLYWLSIDNDGTILRHAKTHLIPQSDSPLTDALILLLKQPIAGKEDTRLLSLIPAGTQLRSVKVKDGVAFIDFSDEFQFNQYGIEGYLAQLAQVVFTATEFSTVDAVQFLIEGQKKEYLGSEGVWIGTPLTRSLF